MTTRTRSASSPSTRATRLATLLAQPQSRACRRGQQGCACSWRRMLRGPMQHLGGRPGGFQGEGVPGTVDTAVMQLIMALKEAVREG
jgi:hypothetical protein